jgi:hypothetical protein
LSISKTHSGSFVQGQIGAAYSVTVSNSATTGPTSGMVTVTETVPAGLILESMSGTGWTCTGATCTRNDSLGTGISYDTITVLVNVASNAATPQVNQVTVTGGGSAQASYGDSTAILSPCDVNQDGNLNVADVQKAIDEALGALPAVNDLNLDGVVNVVDIQIVINASLSLGCSL